MPLKVLNLTGADFWEILQSLQNMRVKMSTQSAPFCFTVGWTGTNLKLCWIGQIQRRTNNTTAIDLLPDELLLNIFDHIRHAKYSSKFRHTIPTTHWQVLVHVCCRWRQIVFASPRRLDLQLLCTNGIPVKKYLSCWPAFPIIILYDFTELTTPNVEYDVVTALVLEHRSRISQINLAISSSLWSKMSTVMREPFPMLTSLSIYADDGNLPSIPSGFFGGSAPHLREILFHGILTPALPALLSYKSNLVELDLFDWDTPRTDFISPAALAACLAVLPKLKILRIALPSWTSHLGHRQIDLPPKTRVVLPALTSFSLQGEHTYLEDFVAQIYTPRLDLIDIVFPDLPDSRLPQLSDYINRSCLRPPGFEDAKIYFDDCCSVVIELNSGLHQISFSIHILSCQGSNNQVWCMAHVLHQISGILSNVDYLEINEERWQTAEVEDEDMDMWLELLRPFTAVGTLHICEEFAKNVVYALEGKPAETDNQVLPALNQLLLFLEDESTPSVDHLFTALRGRDRPVTVTIQRSQFKM